MDEKIIDIRIDGTRDVAKVLRYVADVELTKEWKQGLKASAEIVAVAERGIAPERSGHLKGTIRTGATTRSAVVRTGTNKYPYAGPIIFGWRKRHISPNDFPQRALDSKEAVVVRRIEQAIDDAIASLQ